MLSRHIYHDQAPVQAHLSTAAEIDDASKWQLEVSPKLAGSFDDGDMAWNWKSSFTMNFKPLDNSDSECDSMISKDMELDSDCEIEADISCSKGR